MFTGNGNGKTTVVGISLLAALDAARMDIDPTSDPRGFWGVPDPTEQQTELIDLHGEFGPQARQLPDMEGFATRDEQAAIAWIRDRGLEMSVPPVPPGGYLVLAAQRLGFRWKSEAELTTVYSELADKHFDGFELQAHVVEVGGCVVVGLQTQSDGMVCIATCDWVNEYEAYRIAARLHAQFTAALESGQGAEQTVRVPSVQYNRCGAIVEAIGLQDPSGLWKIVAAQQDLTIRLDRDGFESNEGSLVMPVFLGGASKFTVNRPFLMWACEQGSEVPGLAAYVGFDCWQEESR